MFPWYLKNNEESVLESEKPRERRKLVSLRNHSLGLALNHRGTVEVEGIHAEGICCLENQVADPYR